MCQSVRDGRLESVMAEESKVKTFSTKTVYYDVERDDDGKVISKTQTGVSPSVAIELPDWMSSVEAFDRKFKDLKDAKAIRDDILPPESRSRLRLISATRSRLPLTRSPNGQSPIWSRLATASSLQWVVRR